ncbi:secreted protein [Colletotrichum karsti]|uniref:Secreted protein n=1 Tax=Colletotrichum karsti TaxID=1095194 RepID=A0A9P6HXQ9_9PEZI|nr:uncharacterized protein CkaCkLH20_12317 [Colletotrichum karsti]KAF9870231.1 secreted protein [Colletotrichum karsti]
MKFTTATFAVLATAVLASPTEKGYSIRSAEEVKDGLLPLSDMIFTGLITSGGPNVTLSGPAESIYKQILALNPDFDSLGSGVDERGLEARQGNVNCQTGAAVESYYSSCAGSISHLLALGTSYCSVAASTCARVACSSPNCSMYLCNNQFSQVSVYCRDIAADMGIIVSRCGTDNGKGDTRARGSLGFTSHYTLLSAQTC